MLKLFSFLARSRCLSSSKNTLKDPLFKNGNSCATQIVGSWYFFIWICQHFNCPGTIVPQCVFLIILHPRCWYIWIQRFWSCPSTNMTTLFHIRQITYQLQIQNLKVKMELYHYSFSNQWTVYWIYENCMNYRQGSNTHVT